MRTRINLRPIRLFLQPLWLIAACLLFSGCRTPAPEPDSDRITVSLDDVPVHNVLRMCVRISNGYVLTEDSLPREELMEMRVTLKAENVTFEEMIQRVATASHLNIEWVQDHSLFRVRRASNPNPIGAGRPPVRDR